MPKERTGAILLVSSPQNSKNNTLPSIDLLGSRTFRGVVTKFDSALGLDFAGSLHPDKQVASVVMSVASHTDFMTRLREELRPGYLFAADNTFRPYLMGHSIGEMAGFIEAGITPITPMAKVLQERERITTHPLEAGVRSMIAVTGIDVERLELALHKISETLGKGVEMVLANRNTPTQVVLSIHSDEVDKETIARRLPETLAELKHPLANRLRVLDLGLPNAFHASFLMVEEALFGSAVRQLLNESNFQRPPRGVLYSPMFGGWVNTRREAMDILYHQLTRPVDFRGAMLELRQLPDLVAIVTADILDVTPRLVEGNLGDDQSIPVFNIKSEETMQQAVAGCSRALNKYKQPIVI